MKPKNAIYHKISRISKYLIAISIIWCLTFLVWDSSHSFQLSKSVKIADHTRKNYARARELSKFALPTLSSGLSDVLNCTSRPFNSEVQVHGDYTLLKNYVRASRKFECYETVTYTTHCDFNFLLDNVSNLLQRWNSALSIAIYSPGNDFYSALNRILWLRNCIGESAAIRRLVSFSLFFENKFPPIEYDANFSSYESTYQCIEPIDVEVSFKLLNHLTYPINVARNLARDAASTHFVLSSDVELYPSENFVGEFFKMIRSNPEEFLETRRVFVLPVFEVDETAAAPRNKSQLVQLMRDKLLFWFHETICPSCHRIPQADQWIAADDADDIMHVFFAANRVGAFRYWEPIFVGTHDDPLFDERLNWEGKSDKMSQNYIMCLLEYEYDILSNAFLVHKPGIKKLADAARPQMEAINRRIIYDEILPEIDLVYDENEDCEI